MDENLYDEFGNYIGPEIEDLDRDNDDIFQDGEVEAEEQDHIDESINNLNNTRQNQQQALNIPENEKYSVTLYEDKNYYPEAEEIYPGVETLVMEEDYQPLTEPIVPPIATHDFDIIDKKTPETNFEFDFLAGLMTRPELIRNIALAGNLHHGKSTFMDLLIQETHNENWDLALNYKYTDCRQDEQQRGLSIKSMPMSLILQNSRNKSYLINLFDTPGHPNFSDEVSSAFRLCDGVLIIVDAVEGVQLHTEKIISAAIKENLDLILCINKIDRLALELKLPPNDAYFKIKHIIDEYNRVIAENSHFNTENKSHYASPISNVVFSSASFGIIFTLESYAKKYNEIYGTSIDSKQFSKFLWGDVYFNKESRKFSRKPSEQAPNRSFVDFVLEPMYKLLGYTISDEKDFLEKLLFKLNIQIKISDYKRDPKPLLRLVCGKFYGHYNALIDMFVEKIVDARHGSMIKIRQTYTGDKNSEIYNQIIKCEGGNVLALQVTKLYHKYDYISFDAFARVLSGTIKKGDIVKVLGEKYNTREEEDVVVREVTNMWVFNSRYRVEINKVPACNWVLLEGIDISINKTATITHVKNQLNSPLEIFKPLDFFNQPWMKVSVEPLNPSELPKMLEGLRKINKSYPICKTKTEESGEHIILGTGELYIDCILHDLRKLYSEIEIKVSDPVVTFSETVIETSSIKCYADTNNKKNRITMIAEPMEKNLWSDLENGILNTTVISRKDLEKELISHYGYDTLTARSVWAFAPEQFGTDMLIDYTLPTETDKVSLNSIRDSIVQGFDWACREGPLCEEPIRNTKFKILDAKVSSEGIFRASGQVIPTARRVCYSAFLMASPRLMEPMLRTEIICPIDCIAPINAILARRRGHVNSELPKPGTPFYIINADIPALDSFGFETDLRTTTAGQAFALTWFDHWGIMPGDPLDRTIEFQPLEPSPPPHLAREAMIKTRRRKGLLEDITISKFFDDPMLLELVKRESDLFNEK
jgi:116 kDa U5 small nuclear ribonucleoprotein component